MALVVSYGPGGPRIARFGPWAVGRDGLGYPNAKERARACLLGARTDLSSLVNLDPVTSRTAPDGMRSARFLHERCCPNILQLSRSNRCNSYVGGG